MSLTDNEAVASLIEVNRSRIIRRFLDADRPLNDDEAQIALQQPQIASLNRSLDAMIGWLRQPQMVGSAQVIAAISMDHPDGSPIDPEMGMQRMTFTFETLIAFIHANFTGEVAANAERRLRMALATGRMTLASEMLRRSNPSRLPAPKSKSSSTTSGRTPTPTATPSSSPRLISAACSRTSSSGRRSRMGTRKQSGNRRGVIYHVLEGGQVGW